MEPASVAYRYRKFDLGSGNTVVCRTELHGYSKKGGDDQYMAAFAINEFQPPNSTNSGQNNAANAKSTSWRDKIDSQRGTVLATELKNNAHKIAKWTAQSLLAGADQMKIGYVSRASPKNAYEHLILATQSYRPKDFAAQITLNEGSMWGIVRMLSHLFADQPEGKYVIMRNPNRAVLRVYGVPPGTFEDEEDEDKAEE